MSGRQEAVNPDPPVEPARAQEDDSEPDPHATASIGEALSRRSWSLSVAESLTGGLLVNRFAEAEGASDWLAGGVVTYTRPAKQTVLGAGDGPLVSERTATQMATGAARLFATEVALAATGAAGPAPHDGAPPGEVWLAVVIGEQVTAARHDFEGDAVAVCRQTCEAAVALLEHHLADGGGGAGRGGEGRGS